jgi:glycosyltransferase involved in cell wall biosynthesis
LFLYEKEQVLMRIALIAPPFISVPPRKYGGTELFIAHLARGLRDLGLEPVVYTNGESTIDVERRWLYSTAQWPIEGEIYDNLKDVNHTAWAVADAARHCDIVHLNNIPGLVHARFLDLPFVYTVHHVHDDGLSEFYQHYSQVQYVTISDFQRRHEPMPHVRTIHHGIDLDDYRVGEKKQPYAAFIGRIAPMKGVHLAIQAAKRAGVPLKIAGEVQPIYRDYYEQKVKPHLDGRNVEYIGEADLAAKNELLGSAVAMLFPIQWHEPFGLVMIESMACGTPVIAFAGGAVEEVVSEGVSGSVCRSVEEIATHLRAATSYRPAEVRAYVARRFSREVMAGKYAALYAQLIKDETAAVSGTAAANPLAA